MIDHGRKGFIEYTIIPCRRLNGQVNFSCVFFYPSYRFPVEHVQTPGGRATFEAWKALIVDVLFLTILLNILFFLLVEIRRDVLVRSLLPLASLLSCTVITMAGNCLSGIWDRFSVEHVHTPGGQLLTEVLS